MALLMSACGEGYPVGYLLARLHGRRARLAAVAGELAGMGAVGGESSETGWPQPAVEAAWLCRQLEPAWQWRLQPVLLPFTYRRLILACRWLQAGQPEQLAALLDDQVPCDRLATVLRQATTLAEVLARLDRLLAPTGERQAGLLGAWRAEGLAGVERLLLGIPLAAGCRAADPAVRVACRYQVDALNLLTVYKLLRWGRPVAAPLLDGGVIGKKRLAGVLDQGDTAAVYALARTVSGLADTPNDGPTLELHLWRGFSRLAARLAREPDGSGLVVQYVWLCTLLARNREVLRLNRELPPGLLQEELLPWPA